MTTISDVPIDDLAPGSAALEASGAFLTGFCRPDEARALASQTSRRAGILGRHEVPLYQGLRCEKRRLDWLAGRLAAKRALRRYFCDLQGRSPALTALEISYDSQGAPRCALPQAPFLSISHCAAGGLCAVGLSGRRVGADWEVVVSRGPELTRLFACPGELPLGPEDPFAQTRLWALKEAALKLLGLGLAAAPTEVRAQPWLGLAGRTRQRWEDLGSPALSPVVARVRGCVAAVVHSQPRA